MQATETEFLRFLSGMYMVVPVYQRPYSWTNVRWSQLWEDIEAVGADEISECHFMGSIVYVGSRGSVTHRERSDVIDGQQRLTTVSLLIAAIADRLTETGDDDIEGLDARGMRGRFLLDEYAATGPEPRIQLSSQDDESYRRVVLGNYDRKGKASDSILKAYKYYSGRVKKATEDELQAVLRGLQKLRVIDVHTDQDKEDPQRIYEGMNATGERLGPVDLVRNCLLQGLDRADQEKLYDEKWGPMERSFPKKGKNQFGDFVRQYLAMRHHRVISPSRVYETFKPLVLECEGYRSKVFALADHVGRHASFYKSIIGHGDNPVEVPAPLRAAFDDIARTNAKSSNAAYPFLLELYRDWVEGRIEDRDFEAAVRLAESYVVRRVVCGFRSQGDNRSFSEMLAGGDPNRSIDSIRRRFRALGEGRRFPQDAEFIERLENVELYHKNKSVCHHVLARLETDGKKEKPADISDYTVEHVMPQTLTSEWGSLIESWFLRRQ